MIMTETCDAVIMGGGAAGLTLALQLKQARPEISMLVIERQQHPVPEAAHKVGESTVEIAGRYLRDVLGLREHLESRAALQVRHPDVLHRRGQRGHHPPSELGGEAMPQYDVSSFQLDRGRLENPLADDLIKRGVDLVYGEGRGRRPPAG